MSPYKSNAQNLRATAKNDSVGSNWGSASPLVKSEPHKLQFLAADPSQQTALDETLVITARSGPLTDSSAGVKVKTQLSEKATFTIREASAYSGLSRSFLYDLFDQRRVPRLKAGKRVLIMKSDLDAYLQSLREVAIK